MQKTDPVVCFFVSFFCRLTRNRVLFGSIKKYLTSLTHYIGTAPFNHDNTESVFGFAIVWQNGTSTTVWTAQCLVCVDGHEKIFTSWLERFTVGSRKEISKSTRIGKDTFTRFEQQNSANLYESSSVSPPTVRTNIKIWDTDVRSKPCSISGTWYNQLGSETILNQKNDGIIEGEYRTGVERKPGSAGKSFSKVLGIGQVGGPSSTLPLMVVWKGGESVTGWLAQCFIDGENKTEIVETAWLLRAKVDTCLDTWKSTMFGQDTFTRTEQRAGPRKKDNKHVPLDRKTQGEKQQITCGGGGQHYFNSFAFLNLILINSLAQWLK